MLFIQIYLIVAIIWALISCYQQYKRDDLGAMEFPGRVWLMTICFTLNFTLWPIAMIFAAIHRDR